MPKKISDQQLLDIAIPALRSGESVPKIAARMGVCKQTLYRRVQIHEQGLLFGWTTSVQVPTDQAVLGYIAGLFDGEGSISHTHHGDNAEGFYLRIGMTDKDVIEWLGQFGGKVTTAPPRTPNRKCSYHWAVTRKTDVYLLLTALLPHLKVKREKALACLAHPMMQRVASVLAARASLPPGQPFALVHRRAST